MWKREHRFEWAGQPVHQREDYYLVRVDRFKPRAHGWTSEEHRDLLEFRWWDAAGMDASRDEFVPLTFADLLRAIVSGCAPASAIDVF